LNASTARRTSAGPLAATGSAAALEPFRGAGQVLERPRQPARDPPGRAEDEQEQGQSRQQQAMDQPRIRPWSVQPSLEPDAVVELGGQEHRPVVAQVAVRTVTARRRLGLRGCAHRAHRHPRLAEGGGEALLDLGVARHALPVDEAPADQTIVGAGADAMGAEQKRAPLGQSRGDHRGRLGEAADRRPLVAREAQLLLLVEDEGEVDRLGDEQGRADQKQHLAEQARRHQPPHGRDAAAARLMAGARRRRACSRRRAPP
jgi:hypothetical protein